MLNLTSMRFLQCLPQKNLKPLGHRQAINPLKRIIPIALGFHGLVEVGIIRWLMHGECHALWRCAGTSRKQDTHGADAEKNHCLSHGNILRLDAPSLTPQMPSMNSMAINLSLRDLHS